MATTVSGSTSSGSVQQFFDSLAKNSRAVVIALAVFLVLAALSATFLNKQDARTDEANNAFYLAKKSYTTELTAIAKESNPTKPDTDAVFLKKVDVNSKFPQTLKKFQEVAEKYKGTTASFQAAVGLGDLHFRHGDPANSVIWYQRAISDAPDSFAKALTWSNIGYAQENSNKITEAIESFQKSLNYGEAALKGDLLLALARCYQLNHDTAKAKAMYDRIGTELKDSPTAKTAETLKASLE